MQQAKPELASLWASLLLTFGLPYSVDSFNEAVIMLIIGSLNVCLKTGTVCRDHAVWRVLSVFIYKSVPGLPFVHLNGKNL